MSDTLEKWQQRVDEFAGARTVSKRQLWKELQQSQLSKSVVLPTSQVIPAGILDAEPVTLCEMRAGMPLAVDVTISVPNILRVDTAAMGFLITWGATRGIPQVAEVDLGRGWRFPFFGNYLRVDMLKSREGIPINGSQPDDLRVSASISPATGARAEALKCTRFFRNLANGIAKNRQIPAFADSVQMSAFTPNSFNATIQMSTDTFASRFKQTINGANIDHPSWIFNNKRWQIPQGATKIRLQNFSPDTMIQAVAIFRLAL